MPRYHIALHLDEPAPGEAALAALIDALPHGGAGHLPDGSLYLGVHLHAPDAVAAATLGAGLAAHAMEAAGLARSRVDRVDVDLAERAEQRADAILDRIDHIPPLLSVTEAAAVLGVTPSAARMRAQAGKHGAVKVGDAWVFPRRAVELDAPANRKDEDD